MKFITKYFIESKIKLEGFTVSLVTISKRSATFSYGIRKADLYQNKYPSNSILQ